MAEATPAFGSGLRRRFQRWLTRRIPPARTVTLDQKRLFIFPSRAGFFFAVTLLVMLIAAINYQNNMTYALTFLLATLFIVAVLHTFANLAGLQVQALGAQPAFPGQQTRFDLLIEKTRQREHHAVHLQWPDATGEVVNLVDSDSQRVSLHQAVGERGWYNPGRLLIESTYPLGLLRCWTWIDLDLHALVYPRPLACAPPAGLATDKPDGSAILVAGNDDFYGFRDYQVGDSLRRVHWKGLAKGQTLQSKQYGAYADCSAWLDWDAFPGAPMEARLSYLCYWVLEFDAANIEYGLRLPGVSVAPGVGPGHRQEVLKQLALYGIKR